ncbi:MAG: glycosyltransferase, partial [Candidatus Omnitrophica bacterium]|nr:glycosyltransferase [Candidatus Omnitrophota bacterium]
METKDLRILWIGSEFYPYIIGGVGRKSSLLVNALSRNGLKVMVLTRGKKRSLFGWQRISGIKIYFVKQYLRGFLGSLWAGLCWLMVLYRERNGYDIICAQQLYSATLIACLIKGFFKKKVIAQPAVSGEIQRLRKRIFGELRYRIIKKFTDYFIAICEDIREDLLNNGIDKKKIIKIPNGVDTDIFRPVSKEERQRFYADLNLPRYSYIIFCGRLEE